MHLRPELASHPRVHAICADQTLGYLGRSVAEPNFYAIGANLETLDSDAQSKRRGLHRGSEDIQEIGAMDHDQRLTQGSFVGIPIHTLYPGPVRPP